MEYCIYLDWSGWKPEVWAAWAQAILSGAAIYAAGRFAVAQHRREIGQRVGSVTALLAMAADDADRLADSIQGHVGSAVAASWSFESWEDLERAFAAIVSHELPDEGLVHPVMYATRTTKAVRERMHGIKARANTSYPITTQDATLITEWAKQLRVYYGQAVEIDRMHRPLTLRARLNIWRASRAAKSKAHEST